LSDDSEGVKAVEFALPKNSKISGGKTCGNRRPPNETP